MFSKLRRSMTGLVPLSLFLGAAVPSLGCGFDGMLDGSFSAMHPKSIAVAFAIRDAVEAGVVEKSAIDPIVPNSAGYWRAVGHLNAFQRRLSAAAAQSQPHIAVAVLFIDSGLWARYSLSPHGFDLEVHTAGARDGEAVIVTSEAILAAIVDGRMAVDVAFARGAMVIDGFPPSADAIRRLIIAALSRPSPPDTRTTQTRSVRFFGPPQ
jgi:hypothetical protein